MVVFSFSKKKCEEIADYLRGMDMLDRREKKRVVTMMKQVTDRLSPSDAELPQVNRIRELLSRGIGIHHGGLLPILKETVEMLFSESIVKVCVLLYRMCVALCVLCTVYREPCIACVLKYTTQSCTV